jgi:Na+:H+ antiporter, NhaA family
MLNSIKPPVDFIRDFIRLESFGGILLFISAIVAMIVANSPLASLYDALLDTTVAIQVGSFEINKALHLFQQLYQIK